MSRTANHGERRRQITSGVRVVAGREGLGQVTLGKAAEAADVSVGLVQHYFASKEELLIETAITVRSDVLTRVDAAIAEAEKDGARIETMLADGLAQMLPLDERRREEVYLVQAFASMAVEHSSLRQHVRAGQEQMASRVDEALRNGKQCGEVDADTDTEAAGYAAIALADGLSAHLLIHADRAQRVWARTALAEQSARLCPGTCNHYSHS